MVFPLNFFVSQNFSTLIYSNNSFCIQVKIYQILLEFEIYIKMPELICYKIYANFDEEYIFMKKNIHIKKSVL